MEYVLSLEQLDRSPVPVAGGRGANLGETVRAGLPVPPVFVATVKTWDRFIEDDQTRHNIAAAEQWMLLDRAWQC